MKTKEKINIEPTDRPHIIPVSFLKFFFVVALDQQGLDFMCAST